MSLENRVDKLESTVQRITYDVERVHENRERDRETLLELKAMLSAQSEDLTSSMREMVKDNRNSLREVHDRVDGLVKDRDMLEGFSKGRRSALASLSKIIMAIVGLIAIFGFLGRESSAMPDRPREAMEVNRELIKTR